MIVSPRRGVTSAADALAHGAHVPAPQLAQLGVVVAPGWLLERRDLDEAAPFPLSRQRRDNGFVGEGLGKLRQLELTAQPEALAVSRINCVDSVDPIRPLYAARYFMPPPA